MSSSHRTARACQAAAIGLSACAAYSATHHWLYALPGVVGASVFLAVADSYRSEDRRIRARHEQARRAARSDAQLLALPAPCCSFWRNSDGQVHGPDCTRPPDARRQLDDGCCERWWTSLGAEHDTACPTLAHRSAA
jgi:hypothetical protein